MRRAAQPLARVAVDVAVRRASISRAHRLEALEVLVDRPRADRAAAGQRHARPAVARDQRPEHEHRRAHRLDQLVGRLVTRRRPSVSTARDALARVDDVAPRRVEQPPHRAHVAQRGDVAIDRAAARRAATDARIGSAAFFDARDAHLAAQARAAADDDLLQGRRAPAALRGSSALAGRGRGGSGGRGDAGVLVAQAALGARLPACFLAADLVAMMVADARHGARP